MEKINFNYSLKNIPTPSRSSYQLKLIDKIESVIKRMRWKAFFFLKDNNSNETARETFGFKSKRHPAQITEMQCFEKDLLDMIKSLKFRNVQDDFQSKMKHDISKIKSSPNVFVFADKTTNLYEIPPNDYKRLLHENITKTYKKSTKRLENAINMEAKHIAENIKLDDRIESLAHTPAFITLKDHKENFRISHPCRLINPSKSELGKVSKVILGNVNKNLVNSLKVNQWRNTDSVINWFNAIENKSQFFFIQLDIVEFYPSISENILDNAINFAKQYTGISDKNLSIIKHCRKSLLYNNYEPWKKKDTDSCFDATMGS